MTRLIRPFLVFAASAIAAAAHGQIIFPDGSTQSIAGVEYTHIVVVNSDGNAGQNGTALLAAVAAITTNTSTNRFLVQLEPGDYDLGASTLTMKSFVDIHGSGLTNTTITSTGSSTINAADNAFLQEVRVQNTGAGTTAFTANGVDTELFRVACVHLGTSGSNNAIRAIGGAQLTLVNVLADATATNAGGTNTAALVSGNGSILNLRSTSLLAGGAATIVGLNVAASTVATLGFVQIDIAGSGNGILVAAAGSCSLFSCAVIAPSGNSVNSAGMFGAGASAFDGTVTGGGTNLFAQCFTAQFQPMTNSLPAGTP